MSASLRDLRGAGFHEREVLKRHGIHVPDDAPPLPAWTNEVVAISFMTGLVAGFVVTATVLLT